MRRRALLLALLLVHACRGEERGAEDRSVEPGAWTDSVAERSRARARVPLEEEDVRIGPLHERAESVRTRADSGPPR